MIEELGRHGYKISAGTLYPILHGPRREGISDLFRSKGRQHCAPPVSRNSAGNQSARCGQHKVRELFSELFEDDGEEGRS